jgi:hypothetical protein
VGNVCRAYEILFPAPKPALNAGRSSSGWSPLPQYAQVPLTSNEFIMSNNRNIQTGRRQLLGNIANGFGMFDWLTCLALPLLALDPCAQAPALSLRRSGSFFCSSTAGSRM